MSDLTQQEQQFFESGGEVEVAEPEAASQEPEQTETTQEVETAAPAQEKSEPHLVPYGVFKEAKENVKELKAQLQRLNQERQQWEQWKAQVDAKLNPQQPQVPAFEENPAENLKAEVTQTKEELARIKEANQKAAQEQNFRTWYQSQAQQFAQSTPDFFDAYNAALTARSTELEAQGLLPEQISAQIQKEEQFAAIAAAQMGINPAQMMYQIALTKGYKPAQAKQATQQASQKLQTVADGIKSSKSLSQVSGKAPEGLTVEYLANLPEHEFAKYADKWEDTLAKIA